MLRGNDILRSGIRCHNQNRVLKVNLSSLCIGDVTIIEHLKQDVKDIRMCLLDLIKQNHRIRIPADFLAELTALLITDISWRGTDHLGDAVLLHVLRHINTDQRILCAEHCLRECLTKLRLADTGRTKEEERTDRSLRIFESNTSTADRAGYGTDCLLLTDYTFMKDALELFKTLRLFLLELSDRNLRPSGNDIGNLTFRDDKFP